MKKTLLIILSVLMVISLASCQKDTSDEMIALFEEFASQFDKCTCAVEAAGSANTSTPSPEKNEVRDALIKLENDSTIKVQSLGTVSGQISRTTEDTKDIKDYQNVTISYTYTSSTVTTAADGTLTINGKYTIDYENNAGVKIRTWNFTINGTDYEFSCTTNSELKVTSASVNGRSVNEKLLNSQDYLKILSSET